MYLFDLFIENVFKNKFATIIESGVHWFIIVWKDSG